MQVKVIYGQKFILGEISISRKKKSKLKQSNLIFNAFVFFIIVNCKMFYGPSIIKMNHQTQYKSNTYI